MYSPVSWYVARLSARSSSRRSSSRSVRLIYQMGAPMPATTPSTRPERATSVSGSEKSISSARTTPTALRGAGEASAESLRGACSRAVRGAAALLLLRIESAM